MNRFLSYLLLLVLLIVLGGLVWFFFFSARTGTGNSFIPTNPFGVASNQTTASKPSVSVSVSAHTEDSSSTVKVLERLWDKPVAGYSFVSIPVITLATSTDKKGKEIRIQERSTSTYLYFVEKLTGNVYSKNLDTGTTTRITNTTVANIADAQISKSGQFVFLRTVDPATQVIGSVVAEIPKSAVEGSPVSFTSSTQIQDGVISVVPSLDDDAFYYLVPSGAGSSLYSWSKVKGAQVIQKYPLKELLLSPVRKDGVIVSTKPSAFVEGFVFRSDFSRVYGGKTGLYSLPSFSNGLLLSSMWSGSGLFTFIHSLASGQDRGLSIQTLADKCAWTTSSLYIVCGVPKLLPRIKYGLPDDWYQGAAHFEDSLSLISLGGGDESELYDISQEAKVPIDTTSPSFDTSSSYFGFVNKNDSLLWLLRVNLLTSAHL
jgi:hypothetical protein